MAHLPRAPWEVTPSDYLCGDWNGRAGGEQGGRHEISPGPAAGSVLVEVRDADTNDSLPNPASLHLHCRGLCCKANTNIIIRPKRSMPGRLSWAWSHNHGRKGCQEPFPSKVSSLAIVPQKTKTFKIKVNSRFITKLSFSWETGEPSYSAVSLRTKGLEENLKIYLRKESAQK